MSSVEARFFIPEGQHDPRSQDFSPWGTNEDAGVDFVAILHEARRNHECPQCGRERDYRDRPRSPFCSRECGYRFRDRRRYAENPERERERARAYYWRNRERVLEKAAAKRGTERRPERTTCSECGSPLEGRQRLTCGSAGCRDARFKRLHPEAYAQRERAKVERRRERRRELREGGADA